MPFEHSTRHPHRDTDKPREVIHSLEEIPTFADECEEVAFWDTHELSDELWGSLPPIPDSESTRLERIRAGRHEQRSRRATG